MLRPSRERILRLSREILDALAQTQELTLLKERDAVLSGLASALADELRREEERDQTVRSRIAAMPDAPLPDTPQWHLLFRKFVEEEYVREASE